MIEQTYCCFFRSILSRLLQYKPSTSATSNPSASQNATDSSQAASSAEHNNLVAAAASVLAKSASGGPPKCEDYVNSDGYSGPFFAPIGAIPYKAAPPAGSTTVSSSSTGNIPSVTSSNAAAGSAPAVVKSEG